ncbi:MAG: hypothetical protein H6747_09150 [Deltaproteobacteria bacterium]|nr:hypothetical protein [Deltaproteobacteria bacterium]
MSFDPTGFRAAIDAASPGLEPVAWLLQAAREAPEPGRILLSQAASSLVTRGWLPSLDSLIDLAAEHGGVAAAEIHASVPALAGLGLIVVDDGKVLEFAGTFTTRAGTLRYEIAEGGNVHLIGPIAALAVPRGLGRPGRIVGVCAGGGGDAFRLDCDETGIHTRSPETVAMFLPRWDGAMAPGAAISAGALFADDDALSDWQEQSGDPDGMPLASFMFPMATNDLGPQLGAALESLLDRLANFA